MLQMIATLVNRDEEGASLVEYALLVALIAIVALLLLVSLGLSWWLEPASVLGAPVWARLAFGLGLLSPAPPGGAVPWLPYLFPSALVTGLFLLLFRFEGLYRRRWAPACWAPTSPWRCRGRCPGRRRAPWRPHAGNAGD